jgi:phosphate transport system protein
MFDLVSDGITTATAAFLGADIEVARRLIAEDLLIDELQQRIESMVEQRLTSGEAVSPEEARSMIAVLRIVPELERTGDLVEHIALRTPQNLAAELPVRCRVLVGDMGRIAADMWRLAADAYATADVSTPDGSTPEGSTAGVSAADLLRDRDDALDDLHVSLTAQLANSDVSVAIAIEMGLVARFYERLGDHAVNVARRVQGPVPAGGSR